MDGRLRGWWLPFCMLSTLLYFFPFKYVAPRGDVVGGCGSEKEGVGGFDYQSFSISVARMTVAR